MTATLSHLNRRSIARFAFECPFHTHCTKLSETELRGKKTNDSWLVDKHVKRRKRLHKRLVLRLICHELWVTRRTQSHIPQSDPSSPAEASIPVTSTSYSSGSLISSLATPSPDNYHNAHTANCSDEPAVPRQAKREPQTSTVDVVCDVAEKKLQRSCTQQCFTMLYEN